MSSKTSVPVALAAVAVLVVLGLLWLRGANDDSQAAIDRPSRSAAVTEAPSASLEAPSTDDAASHADVRTAAAPSVAPTKASTEPVDPPDASESTDATLIVRCVAKSTSKPLGGVSVFLARKDHKGPRGAVNIEGHKGSLSKTPVTAKNGEAEMQLPSGCELIMFANGEQSGAGHVQKEVPALAHDERRVIVVELPVGEDLRFAGIVLARDTNTPIAGAHVLVMRSTGWSSDDGERAEKISETTSGADGRFELATASWRSPFLRVEADGFGPTQLVPTPSHATSTDAAVIVLDAGASIDATVRDARGSPIADANVVASAEGYFLKQGDGVTVFDSASSAIVRWQGTTGADGRCTLKDLAPRVPLKIVIQSHGKTLQKDGPPVTLEPKEARAIEWQVGSGCTVNGLLTDENGAPAGDHDIWLMRAEAKISRYFAPYEDYRVTAKARADHDGKFLFADVSPGSWWIGPAPEESSLASARGAAHSSPRDDNALAPFADVIEVQSGESKLDVVVKAQRGLWIRGRVLGADGNNAKQTSVMAKSDLNPWPSSASTADDGTFRLGPMKPGRFELVAHGWGMECSSEPVSASAGDDGVILKLRSGGIIEGKLVDASGNESLHGEILYLRRDSNAYGPTMTSTQPDGTFQLQGLEPGTYDVMARIGDGRVAMSHSIVVDAGVRVSGIVLTLERGAKLKVRYEGAKPRGWFDVRRDGMTIAMDSVSGKQTSEVQVVPAGKLTISMHYDERADAVVREVDVAAGEEKEVVFKDE